MALVAVIVGASTAIAATGRITLSLVATGALWWSLVPVLQLATGLVLVAGVGGGSLPLRLERYFATHWPWSLWIVAFHATLLLLPARWLGLWLAASGAIPLVWTAWLLRQFCRRELGLDARAAWRRVAVHQAITYAALVLAFWMAVALWPRILGVMV